jgi:tetratricopeptide (TPR) repeat protein
MIKYRLRLPSGRVIGPFEKNQLFELKMTGHIKGNEEAQLYPTGSWSALSSFDFYSELMDDNKTILNNEIESKKDDTFLIDLTELRNQQQQKDLLNYDQGVIGPIEELTETKRMPFTKPNILTAQPNVVNLSDPSNPVLSNFEDFMQLMDDQAEMSIKEVEISINEKTIINPVAQKEIEKMRKLQREADEIAKDELLKAKLTEEESIKRAHAISLEGARVSSDESTQMISVNSSDILKEANETEKKIEREYQNVVNDEEQEVEGNEKLSKEKKKKIFILAAFALVFAILFPDDGVDAPKFKHLNPVIEFPVPFDYFDKKKSDADFKKGLDFFNSGSYPDIIRAGMSFKTSYENNVENINALTFLVRTYAEQLKFSNNKLVDAQTIFNLIQSKKQFLLQDPNGVIGLNLFYMTIDKHGAANETVKKYLKLNSGNVTQDLFAAYLASLIKSGKIDEAKQFYLALTKSSDKSRYAYDSIIEYLLLNQEYDKAKITIEESVKKFPEISRYHLLNSELYIRKKETKLALKSLNNAVKLSFDSNNLDRAKYHELKGFIYVLENKPKEAAAQFANSLKINDSEELRTKLADLNSSENNLGYADKIIQESKSVKHLIQAKNFYESNNYGLAISSAAKAVDAFPDHIPSELFLSMIQLKLGLTQEGLKTIEELSSKNPEDKKINLALVHAYIDTFKFYEAKKLLHILSTSSFNATWEFASANAKLYFRMGDSLQAMTWLKNSIALNPLNDNDIFKFSQLLMKKANFETAKMLLLKCMELDPTNPDYRIAYARLLYETQDDLAAIGYLLNLKEDFGENSKIISEIAIFFFRSGKIKDFQDYKIKLEKEHSTDKSLYEFLIKAALLDERNSEIPGLVHKLIAIEPSDYESMMTAGRVLFEDGKLAESAKWFKRIWDKLPSYPKVLYYMAKIDFLSGDKDAALKKIEEDIKVNGENDDDLVFMAQIYEGKGKLADSENLYKKAQKVNPRSYGAILGLADLSVMQNNHDMALDLYKRALKLKEDEPIIHKKIGDVYRQLGQGALAIEAYKLYLDMDPESPHKSNLEAYINLMK